MTRHAPQPIRLLAGLVLACAALLAASGCSTTEPAQPLSLASPPDVRMGPPIELLNGKTIRDKVNVIADAAGQVHVLIASTELRQVIEVVVNRNGVAQRRVIRSDVSPQSIDGAYDAQGRLHVLIDTEHRVFEDDAWRASDRTPWQEAGLKADDAHFVPDAPDLVWAFRLEGDEVGAPRRVEIYGVGGFGAGLIWPWFTHGTRTVIVAEQPAGLAPWAVLEPQGSDDTDAVGLGTDRIGNVHVLYQVSRGGMGANVRERRYAQIGSDLLRRGTGDTPGTSGTQAGTSRFLAITGRAVPAGAGQTMLSIGKELAVDPDSGTTLIGMSWLVRGEMWNGPLDVPLSCRQRPAALAAGAGDTFHALCIGQPHDAFWGKGFPVQYLNYSAKGWSAPIEAGLADTSSFWGSVWYAPGLAGVKGGGAFLVWPVENAIVGRWVERGQ